MFVLSLVATALCGAVFGGSVCFFILDAQNVDSERPSCETRSVDRLEDASVVVYKFSDFDSETSR